MDNKYTLLAVALVVVAGGGFWWWSSRSKSALPEEIEKVEEEEVGAEEVADDEITLFLKTLAEETEIDFSEVEVTEMDWMVEEGTETIVGKGFQAEGVVLEPQQLATWFEDRGFEPDMYNISAGTIVGLVGYTKGGLACTVKEGVSGGEEGMEQGTDLSDVEIKCGKR